jgi:organic radical activating enzyme
MKMTKPVLLFLETMATQACNLSCLGCTNYSDLPHKSYESWTDMQTTLKQWLDVIEIPDFGIMGGEPLLNPEIREWITGVRELMPGSQIRFTTNGLLLHKNLDLLDLVFETGNMVFKITQHHKTAQLEKTIEYIFQKYHWTPVHEYGIDRWISDNGVRFQLNTPERFIKTYRNSYDNMLPYESDPVKSFDICVQKTCPLLYQGRIYKCSTQALLKDTLIKVGSPNTEHWAPYLIDGISSDSPLSEIQRFIDNFGKPHGMCRMCPESTEDFIPHQENVKRRKYVPIRSKVLQQRL